MKEQKPYGGPGKPEYMGLMQAFYDIQESRIATENRLRQIFGSNEKMIEGANQISLKRKQEENLLAREIRKRLDEEPIWNNWLDNVRGIGEILAAGMLGYAGYCEKFEKATALWHYFGLHVVDGKAPKRQRGVSIDWNPNARMFAYRISDCLVKQGREYKEIYDEHKKRYLARAEKGELPCSCNKKGLENHKGKHYCQTKGHAHMMAMRAMVKLFLSHYWEVGRRLKGLEINEPYAMKYLQHDGYIPPPNFKP